MAPTRHLSGPAALLACALLLLPIGACRQAPLTPGTGPAAPAPPDGGVVLDPLLLEPGVPEVREVRADQVGTDLHVMVMIQGRDRRGEIRYDPYQPGGWSFQMFLDTDRQPTGYWLGYDFLTRDSESDLGGRAVRVRRTLAVQEPGADGWGEETAVVPLRVSQSSVSFRIPLTTIADHDGHIDYAFEVYRTVACPECPGGRTHEYAYHVFGTSDANGRVLLRRVTGREARHGHFARALAPLAAR